MSEQNGTPPARKPAITITADLATWNVSLTPDQSQLPNPDAVVAVLGAALRLAEDNRRMWMLARMQQEQQAMAAVANGLGRPRLVH